VSERTNPSWNWHRGENKSAKRAELNHEWWHQSLLEPGGMGKLSQEKTN
jgi:hypothetical protein